MSQIGAATCAQGYRPHKDCHRRNLGGRGNIGGDLIGSPLVCVRGPEMKWEDGKLKEEAAQSEEQPDDGCRPPNCTGKHLDNFRHIGGVDNPVE